MVIEVNGIELHLGRGRRGPTAPLAAWRHGVRRRLAVHVQGAPPGYRLIAPDLRGHGSSTNPSGTFTFRQCAGDMLALLAHLNLQRVKAIGVSGGGIVLLHMATAVPGSIASMVVVSAPPYFPNNAESSRANSPSRWSAPPKWNACAGATRAASRRFGNCSTWYGIRRLLRRCELHAVQPGDDHGRHADRFRRPRPPLRRHPGAGAVQVIPRSYLWVVPNGGHGPVFGDAGGRIFRTALPFLRGDWRSPASST